MFGLLFSERRQKMNKVMKKFCLIMVAVLMMMVCAAAVYADETDRSIKIGGVELLQQDGSVKQGVLPAGMEYDLSSPTITITDCTLIPQETATAYIEVSGFDTFLVNVKGANVFKGAKGTGRDGYIYGIKASCPLEIYGDGSLDLDFTESDGKVIGVEGAERMLTEGVKLNINGGDSSRHGDFYGIRMIDNALQYLDNSTADPFTYYIKIKNAEVNVVNKCAFASEDDSIINYDNCGIDSIDSDLRIENSKIQIKMTDGGNGKGINAGAVLGGSWYGYDCYGGVVSIDAKSRVNIQLPGAIKYEALRCKYIEPDETVNRDDGLTPSEKYSNLDIISPYWYYADRNMVDLSDDTLTWNQYIAGTTMDEYGTMYLLEGGSGSDPNQLVCKHSGLDLSPAPVTDHEIPDMNGNSDGGDSNVTPVPDNNVVPIEDEPLANGDVVKLTQGTFQVKSAAAKTVTYYKSKNNKSIIVPAAVVINGESYKVVEIAANSFIGSRVRTVTVGKNVKTIKKNAFAKSKVTKVVVKTKLFKKNQVKGSLKSSKVKTLQVKVGSKKVNKKFVKTYKKIFTKKNAGRKVKVK